MNKWINDDIVAKEIAYRVRNTKSAKLMHIIKHQYDSEFARKDGSVVRIRVSGTLEAHFFNDGEEVILQDYTESSINLELNKQIDVSVQLSQREATFNIDDFTKFVSEDAANAIAKKFEQFCVEEAVLSLSNIMVTGDLDSSDKLIDINTFFDEREVDNVDRIGLLSTLQKSIVMKKCKDIVETYKRGKDEVITGAEIGFVFGVNYSYSNVLNKLAKDVVAGTYTGGGTMAVKALEGASFINVTGATAGQTIKMFTVFKAGDVHFVVQEDTVVESDGTAIIKTKSLQAEVASGSAVDYVGVVHSLAFDKNSMVFASVAPEKTVNEEMAYINDTKYGFGISINWGHNIMKKKGVISFSTFAGFLNVNRDLNVGLVTAA